MNNEGDGRSLEERSENPKKGEEVVQRNSSRRTIG